eukprot:CFRG3090T1
MLDIFQTQTSTPVVSGPESLSRIGLDSENFTIVVYFVICFTGLLQLPLIIDALDSILPNGVGRATHKAVSLLLIIGIFTVYLGCLFLYMLKVLPYMQHSYGMSFTVILSHGLLAAAMVTNGLSHFSLAIVLQPRTWVSMSSSLLLRQVVEVEQSRDTPSDKCPATDKITSRSSIVPACGSRNDGLIGGYACDEYVNTESLGILPSQLSIRRTYAANKAQSSLDLCRHCKLMMNRYEHHCHTCGCCSAYMDHHCPFIMGCVWEINYVHFFLFLMHSVSGLLYSLWVTYPILFSCFLVPVSEKSEACRALGAPLAFMAVPLTMLTCLTLALFIFELFLLYLNLSTFSFLKGLNGGTIKFICASYYARRNLKSQSPSRFEMLVCRPIQKNGWNITIVPPLSVIGALLKEAWVRK